MTPRKHLLSHQTGCSAYYHCISKVVSPHSRQVPDRNFVFQDHERGVFGRILRQVEAFSGVEVLTWTILSNHFHLLLRVPPRPATPPPDDEILERCRQLYSRDSMKAIEVDYARAASQGEASLQRWREPYLMRMWDLSEFMKTLKQKFTQWFNTRHDRDGTLWERRFKSLLVEGDSHCLMKVAAYIDLNAVRAGLCEDPKDYRWCGYAQAVAGSRQARRGLVAVMAPAGRGASWRDAAPAYRKVMFGLGEPTGERAGLSREAIAKVWAEGGRLSLPQLLRCRLRHMSDGVALGSASFTEEFFGARREMFSAGRKSGARKLARGEWGGLTSLRDLRSAVRPPAPG